MKGALEKITLLTGQVRPSHLQLVFVILTLILFIIGAGAPEDGGGGICSTCPS